jgi:acetyl-CoA synthetase
MGSGNSQAMLTASDSYERLCQDFRWRVPERYNIGVDVCDRWAAREPDRIALTFVGPENEARDYTYGDLRAHSNRLASLLRHLGIDRGDRVAVLLPQAPQTAIGHIAIYKLAAIAVPLFALFGPEALQYRLADSAAKAVITSREGAAKLSDVRTRLPELKHVLCVDGAAPGCRDLARALRSQPEEFVPVDTAADDPALLIYTSGTTGQPKGVLHAHRVLLGHLPGVEMSHDLLPQPGDKIWTPADWAWIGGLLDVLMPALHHGVPVVARRFEKFSGEAAFRLIQDFGIRNAFLPPTALKIMRAVPEPEKRWRVAMRSIASGGETLGAELIEWGRRVFGLTINEFYGQTECNMIVSSCARLMAARLGIMGRAVPGHHLAVVDHAGSAVPPGTLGTIAVKRPDPVMFLQYWRNPEATRAKFVGDWLLTGDTGRMDEEGWIRFVGRDDDVITSAGYRIGPGEIEDCLLGHPAVRLAGVVGKPDPERTEIVKAYVVLKEGHAPGKALARDIQAHVKTRLAAHEYPREVEFMSELPMTTTGKIIRRELRARAAAEAAATKAR